MLLGQPGAAAAEPSGPVAAGAEAPAAGAGQPAEEAANAAVPDGQQPGQLEERGNLIGPVVGAAILILIPEVFRFLQEYRMFVYGSILVVMMLVRRQGLLGDKQYSLRWKKFDEKEEKVYERGDKFLPDDHGDMGLKDNSEAGKS